MIMMMMMMMYIPMVNLQPYTYVYTCTYIHTHIHVSTSTHVSAHMHVHITKCIYYLTCVNSVAIFALHYFPYWALILSYTVYRDTIVGWKVHMMTSYLLLITFLPMGTKHCNTDGKVWARGTMSKNKPHLATFSENILVSLWSFQLTFVDRQINKWIFS